jgi:hypothetical protein
MEETVTNLRTVLHAGFTSINGAAATKVGVEATLRGLVHSGRVEVSVALTVVLSVIDV